MISDKLKKELISYIEKHFECFELELADEICAPKCCSEIKIDLSPSFSETLLDFIDEKGISDFKNKNVGPFAHIFCSVDSK